MKPGDMVRRPHFGFTLFVLVILSLTGCKKVHHRVEDFEWSTLDVNGGVRIDLITTGTAELQDSSGVLIERNTSPYRIGIYFKRPEAISIELRHVIFRGQTSGRVISPNLLPLTPLGDSSLTLVAVAPAVELPFEDYIVRLHVVVGEGSSATELWCTGYLKTSLKTSEVPVWKELISA